MMTNPNPKTVFWDEYDNRIFYPASKIQKRRNSAEWSYLGLRIVARFGRTNAVHPTTFKEFWKDKENCCSYGRAIYLYRELKMRVDAARRAA